MYNLIQLGWNEFFENQFQVYKNQEFIPARVAAENKQRYILFTEAGELTGEVTGRLLYSSETQQIYQKVQLINMLQLQMLNYLLILVFLSLILVVLIRDKTYHSCTLV